MNVDFGSVNSRLMKTVVGVLLLVIITGFLAFDCNPLPLSRSDLEEIESDLEKTAKDFQWWIYLEYRGFRECLAEWGWIGEKRRSVVIEKE
jgi:hypothetical protein